MGFKLNERAAAANDGSSAKERIRWSWYFSIKAIIDSVVSKLSYSILCGLTNCSCTDVRAVRVDAINDHGASCNVACERY